jgi:ubiquinone/menaquinone biosynthesis C-methylase UbiE
MTESKYIEKDAYLSRYTHERVLALRETATRSNSEVTSEEDWLRTLKSEVSRFVPFLTEKCGLEFRGRILEIGAGGAWLSAEISKLPKVVEVIATDFSQKLLKEQAPKVFKLLKAHTAKITRTPGDFHKLDFPNNHFDYVVCSAVLHHSVNMVQVLREAKRVLKPGGRLVAIREPIWPLVPMNRKRQANRAKPVEKREHYPNYSLADYKEFFKQASLPLQVKRVNLSTGFKYYVNEVVNGLTHARYAFIGVKATRS